MNKKTNVLFPFCIVLSLAGMTTPVFGQRTNQFQANAKQSIALVEAGKFDEAKQIADRLVRQATSLRLLYFALAMLMLMCGVVGAKAQLLDLVRAGRGDVEWASTTNPRRLQLPRPAPGTLHFPQSRTHKTRLK
jgi:hypothetical protein